MESVKEQMDMVHSMCWKEINLLKINLDKLIHDSERCQKLLNELTTSEDVTNIFGLIIFDRYMTQMVTALNMARKYNIHLEINNLDLTVINASSNGCLDETNFTQSRMLKDFIEWRKTCLENDMGFSSEIKGFAGRIKMNGNFNERSNTNVLGCYNARVKPLESCKYIQTKKECASNKTDDISYKINNLLTILLPEKCLRKFKNGFEFEGRIVYVRDYIKLEFFICCSDDYKTFYDIGSNINLDSINIDQLPPDDVFCVFEKKDINAQKCLWRAVIVPDEKKSQKFIYLIDFGEIIPLTDNCQTYLAPLYYRQIPPIAIKCVLEGVEGCLFQCFKDQVDICKQVLRENEFEKANFRVIHQTDRVLHVRMLEKSSQQSSLRIQNSKETNPFLHTKFFEYDDKNSSTNSVELQLPKSIFYNQHPVKKPVLNIPYKVGEKIQVIVTHVVNPISFYGIIQNDNCSEYETFSWHDNQILPLQHQMASPPQVNDIVLAQYAKDGYWYRAKIVNINEKEESYKVFYVDFGNTEVVSLTSLAKCSEEQLKDPLRAVLFHLSNLALVPDKQNVNSSGKKNFRAVIENMVVMILDQIINVEIVKRCNDDLVVRFNDTQYAEIPKMLVDMGVANEI